MQESKDIASSSFTQVTQELSFDIQLSTAISNSDLDKIKTYLHADATVISEVLLALLKTSSSSNFKSFGYSKLIINFIENIHSKNGKITPEIMTAAIEINIFSRFFIIENLINSGGELTPAQALLAQEKWNTDSKDFIENPDKNSNCGYMDLSARIKLKKAVDSTIHEAKTTKRRNIQVIGNGCRFSSVGSFFHPTPDLKIPEDIIRDKIVPLLESQHDTLTKEEFEKFFYKPSGPT